MGKISDNTSDLNRDRICGLPFYQRNFKIHKSQILFEYSMFEFRNIAKE